VAVKACSVARGRRVRVAGRAAYAPRNRRQKHEALDQLRPARLAWRRQLHQLRSIVTGKTGSTTESFVALLLRVTGFIRERVRKGWNTYVSFGNKIATAHLIKATEITCTQLGKTEPARLIGLQTGRTFNVIFLDLATTGDIQVSRPAN
jgi:hypothetical protein